MQRIGTARQMMKVSGQEKTKNEMFKQNEVDFKEVSAQASDAQDKLKWRIIVAARDRLPIQEVSITEHKHTLQ